MKLEDVPILELTMIMVFASVIGMVISIPICTHQNDRAVLECSKERPINECRCAILRHGCEDER